MQQQQLNLQLQAFLSMSDVGAISIPSISESAQKSLVEMPVYKGNWRKPNQRSVDSRIRQLKNSSLESWESRITTVSEGSEGQPLEVCQWCGRHNNGLQWRWTLTYRFVQFVLPTLCEAKCSCYMAVAIIGARFSSAQRVCMRCDMKVHV